MNVFLFTGHLGRDSEVKYAPSGTAICSFPVAVKTGYGQNEKTTWVQCALFGKRAEGELPKYLVKGAQVCITGEVSLNEWQAQDGTNKAAIRVAVDKLDLIGGKPQSAPQSQQQQPQAQPQNAGGFDSLDPEIPF